MATLIQAFVLGTGASLSSYGVEVPKKTRALKRKSKGLCRNSVLSDRYFQAVYSKLFDPQLQKASKLVCIMIIVYMYVKGTMVTFSLKSMFFNILYKSLKLDSSEERVKVEKSTTTNLWFFFSMMSP